MALYLKKADACFLHIPKTGGQWIEQALDRAGIACTRLTPLPYIDRRHGLREHQKTKTCRYYFCFVRHPAAWYASAWIYAQKQEWPTPDRRYWHPYSGISDLFDRPFPQFVHAVCDRYPEGFLSWLYRAFAGRKTGSDFAQVHFVGKTENVVPDLHCILKKIGYCPDRKALESTPPVNVSDHRPTMTPDLRRRILTAESQILRDFDYAAT